MDDIITSRFYRSRIIYAKLYHIYTYLQFAQHRSNFLRRAGHFGPKCLPLTQQFHEIELYILRNFTLILSRNSKYIYNILYVKNRF